MTGRLAKKRLKAERARIARARVLLDYRLDAIDGGLGYYRAFDAVWAANMNAYRALTDQEDA